MMQHEFENRVQEIVGKAVYAKPSDKDWATINTVYAFHPAIKEVGGQQQIAKIYVELGMTVINDMLPRAHRFQAYEAEMSNARAEVARIKLAMEEDGGHVHG